MNYTETMTLVNMDEVLARRGRKPEKCCGCGRGFAAHSDVIQIHYSGRGGDGHDFYGHEPCVLPTFYGDEEKENLSGTQNVTYEKTPRTSFEIEIFEALINPDGRYISETERRERAKNVLLNNINPALTSLYVKLLVFGTKHREDAKTQDIGLDCSTALEGHMTMLSFEGSSKFFYNLTDEQIALINDPHNGAHIHVGCLNVSYSKVFKPVFDVLLNYFKSLPTEKRLEYFNSDFRDYANDHVGYEDHHSCINMSDIPTAELRLARFRDANQYIKLAKVWRGVVKVFNTYAYKVETGQWTAEYLGNKLVKEFKHIDGTKYNKGR